MTHERDDAAVKAEITKALDGIERVSRVRSGLSICLLIPAMLLMVVILVYSVVRLMYGAHIVPILFICDLILFGLLGLVFYTNRRSADNLLIHIGEFAHVADIRLIGPLADIVVNGKQRYRRAVAEDLTEQLNRVTAEDGDCVNVATRLCLHRILGEIRTDLGLRFPVIRRLLFGPVHRVYAPAGIPDDLRIATIECLGRIGNATDLQVIESVAQRRLRTAEDKRLRQAALDVLPALRERVERMGRGDILLRPAYSAEDTLLHPASATSTDAELLLHATHEERDR